MLRWLWITRDRLRDLGVITIILEQAWHSFPEFAAVTVALLLLLVSVLATAAATHSKAVSTEQRLGRLVTDTGAVNVRVSNLSGQATSSSGLPDGTINGSSGNSGLNNGTIGGTSGGASAGTSHTHGPGSYSVNDGHHTHGPGTFAVTSGNHSHSLPTV